MKVRFIGDYNFNGEIIDGLIRRKPSIDFLSGSEADLYTVPDPDVLSKAANEGRALVTHDQRTMPYHFHRKSPKPRSLHYSAEIGDRRCHRRVAFDLVSFRER